MSPKKQHKKDWKRINFHNGHPSNLEIQDSNTGGGKKLQQNVKTIIARTKCLVYEIVADF